MFEDSPNMRNSALYPNWAHPKVLAMCAFWKEKPLSGALDMEELLRKENNKTNVSKLRNGAFGASKQWTLEISLFIDFSYLAKARVVCLVQMNTSVRNHIRELVSNTKNLCGLV